MPEKNELFRTNVPGWLKNTKTGVCINTNTGQLAALKAARIKNKEIQNLKNEVEDIKNILQDICKHLGVKKE